MPLDREKVLPPKNMYDLLSKMHDGKSIIPFLLLLVNSEFKNISETLKKLNYKFYARKIRATSFDSLNHRIAVRNICSNILNSDKYFSQVTTKLIPKSFVRQWGSLSPPSSISPILEHTLHVNVKIETRIYWKKLILIVSNQNILFSLQNNNKRYNGCRSFSVVKRSVSTGVFGQFAGNKIIELDILNLDSVLDSNPRSRINWGWNPATGILSKYY